jgi:hypothetical protein
MDGSTDIVRIPNEQHLGGVPRIDLLLKPPTLLNNPLL